MVGNFWAFFIWTSGADTTYILAVLGSAHGKLLLCRFVSRGKNSIQERMPEIACAALQLDTFCLAEVFHDI